MDNCAHWWSRNHECCNYRVYMAKLTVFWSASKLLLKQEMNQTGMLQKRQRMLSIDLASLHPEQRDRLMELVQIRGTRGQNAGYIKPLTLSEIKWFDTKDGLWRKQWVTFDHTPNIEEIIDAAQRIKGSQQARQYYRAAGWEHLWKARELYVKEDDAGLAALLQEIEAETRWHSYTEQVRELLDHLRNGGDWSDVDPFDLWYRELALELGKGDDLT